MLSKFFPNRSGAPLPEGGEASKTCTLNAAKLAAEYGVSAEIMEAFLNRFTPARVPDRYYAADSDTMLFVHIPKTAGVSVGKSLQKAFDKFHGVQWNDIPRSFRQATRAATYAQSTEKTRQAIMGHFGWPELQVWRNHEMPIKCGTIFRNPIARLISNYNYNCSSAHPDNDRFRSNFPTLEAYAQQIPLDVQLTQAIGLADSFETVLTKLVRYYTFLGVTEQLSAALSHLGSSHGLPSLPEYRVNVGKTDVDASVPPELHRLIEDRSRNDVKIHTLITRLYHGQG